MTPESRKRFNTWMGVLLVVFALTCFGLAGYMIFVPSPSTPAPLPTVSPVNKQACIEGLSSIGFQPVTVGDDIRIVDRSVDLNPLDRLKNASLGISMCHMYLKQFCMGPSCQDPTAMLLVMTPEDPKSPKKGAASAGGSSGNGKVSPPAVGTQPNPPTSVEQTAGTSPPPPAGK